MVLKKMLKPTEQRVKKQKLCFLPGNRSVQPSDWLIPQLKYFGLLFRVEWIKSFPIDESENKSTYLSVYRSMCFRLKCSKLMSSQM